MSKPKAPRPPDPYTTAQTQWQFGNFNQNTPWGSVNLTAPANGQPGSLDLTLAPAQQRQLDLQNQLTEGALGQALGRQGELNNLPGLTSQLDFSRIRGLTDDFSADRQRVEQAYFDRSRGLLDPVFSDQERALRGTMADQGLPAGGEARNYDLGQFFDQRNQAYGRAAQDAILAGGDEQSRMFGLNMQAREAEINDQLQNANLSSTARATLFNELQALLGQQQVAQPGLQNFHSPQGSDFLGAQSLNQAVQNQGFQASNDLYGGMLGGLFNLGAGALSNTGLLGGLFGGNAAGAAGAAGGAAAGGAPAAGSALNSAMGGGGPLASLAGITGGGAGAGLGGLVAGMQPGIEAGLGATAAANEAALLGGAAPSLATGGAGGGAAGAAAGGTTAGGLAAGLGIGALPLAIMLGGGFANDRTARNQLALQQSGLEQTQLAGGTRVLIAPDGTFVPFNEGLMNDIRERWGVVPTEEFWSWFNTLPRVNGNIRRIPRSPSPGRQLE
jgi:hypothetical protein